MAGRVRIITALILAASFLAWQPDASASPQSLDKLKKERQASKKQLRQTRQQINANTRETERNLRALEGLRVDIARQQRIISAANISADSVGRAMTAVEDSIAMAEASLKRLKASYASSLRKMQGQMSPRSRWIFLLSASDIREIYRRARYLKQVKEAQEAKARRVKEARLLLTERRNRLASLNTERRNHLERAALAGRQLEEKRAETDRVIASLRQKKGELQQTLQELEARRRRLDSQIDALIAQQIRNQEEARKKKEAKKKQKTVEIKEVRLSPNIEANDLNTKVNMAKKFIAKGDKVKVTLRFRGREMAHTELGKDVLIRFADALKEFGAVEKQPTMEMRSMYMMIAPIKKEGK